MPLLPLLMEVSSQFHFSSRVGAPGLAAKSAIQDDTESTLSRNGRGSKIRTCDPLFPKQVRYQAAPCPAFSRSEGLHELPGLFKPLFGLWVNRNSTRWDHPRALFAKELEDAGGLQNNLVSRPHLTLNKGHGSGQFCDFCSSLNPLSLAGHVGEI